MTLNEFVEKFAEQFFETDISAFTPDTEFKSLDEWSSMTGLSIIAMVDSELNIQIDGNVIRESETIEDLYNTINSLKK